MCLLSRCFDIDSEIVQFIFNIYAENFWNLFLPEKASVIAERCSGQRYVQLGAVQKGLIQAKDCPNQRYVKLRIVPVSPV